MVLGPFRSFEGVLFSVTLREAFWMMVDLNRLKIIFSTCSGYVQGGGRQRPTAAEMTPPESLVFRRMTPTDPWASENDQQPVGSQLRGWLERKYPDSSEASVNAFLDILTKVLDLDWSSPAMDEYLDDMETASFNWRFGDRTEPQPDMLMNLSSSFRVLVERDVPTRPGP